MRSKMKHEKERLMTMLKDNKISQDDYNLLLGAIKKRSFFSKMSSSLLLNPFQKIAGGKALGIGIVILLCISYLGVIAKVYFLDPISIINSSAVLKQAVEINFLFLAYQNIVSWLVLALLFRISAKVLQKKKTRMIDFLGTVALARFPGLLITIVCSILRVFNPGFLEIDLTKGLHMHVSFGEMVFGITVTILTVWQIITYFYALKESSGLDGKKLWIGFIVSLITACFIGQLLTTLVMN